MLEPRVLVQKATSVRKQAETLKKYAGRSHANWILVSTRGNTGLKRVVYGSFAETLLNITKIPVLLTNTHAHPDFPIKRIIFPTDFSESSKKQFKATLSLAKSLDASIILYHRLISPITPVAQNGVYMMGGGWVAFNQYDEENRREKQLAGEEWKRIAEKQHVPIQVKIDDSEVPIHEGVSHLADSYPHSMICMHSHVGSVGSVLMGSATRQVLREAHCPVMLGPIH
jgi:nucleotide-binding universal stress UspA family protein